MVTHVDRARASALNEQELWREMVRWSGGRIVEERGVLLVSGPSAYRIAFQRPVRNLRPGPELTAARERAFARLSAKVQRLDDVGLLGDKPVRTAAVEFNAMMEGLANAELRGAVFRNLPEGEEERAWRDALTSLVRRFGGNAPRVDARPSAR